MLTGPAAAAGLIVLVHGRRVPVPPARPFVIGRGPEADLDLAHPKVSRRHLLLTPGPAGWTLTDHSSNGTFLGSQRVSRLDVGPSVALRLGGAADGVPVQLVSAGGPVPPAPSQVHPVRDRSRVTVGRLPDNDVVLDDLLVSRRHAAPP